MNHDERTQVAVGIVAHNGKFLLAQRRKNQHLPFTWEFPGGKVEAHECIEDALKRELLEEIGIIVKLSEPFMTIPYDYPDKQVCLFVHRVLKFEGIPKGLENQQIRWVSSNELIQYPVPEANQIIVKALLV